MFFDRLFTLVSLKSRLLNSTSFSQLYSGERLPLSKFRKEGAMLSPLIAGLLAACGGGGGGPIPGPRVTETETIIRTREIEKIVPGDPVPTGGGDDDGDGVSGRDITIAVRKGLVEGAEVYLDRNGDGEVDPGEHIGTTDSDGEVHYLLKPEEEGKEFIVKFTENSFDLLRQEKVEDTTIEYVTEVPTHRNDAVASPVVTTVQKLKKIIAAEDAGLSADEVTTKALEMVGLVGITEDDLHNPANYVPPVAGTDLAAQPQGSAVRKSDRITKVNIAIQSLAEEDDVDIDDVADAFNASTLSVDTGGNVSSTDTDTNAPITDFKTGDTFLLYLDKDLYSIAGIDVFWHFTPQQNNDVKVKLIFVDTREPMAEGAEINAGEFVLNEAANQVLATAGRDHNDRGIGERVFNARVGQDDIFHVQASERRAGTSERYIFTGDNFGHNEIRNANNLHFIFGKAVTSSGSVTIELPDIASEDLIYTFYKEGNVTGLYLAIKGKEDQATIKLPDLPTNSRTFEENGLKVLVKDGADNGDDLDTVALPAKNAFYLFNTAGEDTLIGGAGDDIFLLNLADGERAADVVKDFGTGADKIRVKLNQMQKSAVEGATGDAAKLQKVLDQLDLRIAKEDEDGEGDTNDTIIYFTRGTTDTTDDDEVVMILEDYDTDLTLANIDII